jgi:hypothetical protein
MCKVCLSLLNQGLPEQAAQKSNTLLVRINISTLIVSFYLIQSIIGDIGQFKLTYLNLSNDINTY